MLDEADKPHANSIISAALSRTQADQLWQKFSRTSLPLRIVNRDFERFDLQLEAIPATEAAVQYLTTSTGMPEKIAQKALQLYEQTPPPDKMARLDLIYVHQKKGINLMKTGQKEEAKAALKTAIDMMRAEGHSLPLASIFLRWLTSGYHLDEKRLIAEQRKHQYFSVRKDTVDLSKAIKLPDAMVGPMI